MIDHPSASSPTNREALERILLYLRSALARIADEVRAIDAGFVAVTPSLPAVWWLNQLRVTEPLEFEAVVQLADKEQAALGFRQIALEHQPSGPTLEAAFRQASWKVERDLLMVLETPPDRAPATNRVVEPGEDELMELMARWHDDAPAQTEDDLAQLVASSRREVHAQRTRLLGVRSSGGKLVSMTQLRVHGDIAQVEDVYTAPEARGRGYARALISRAIEIAR